jgi:SnoaL-like protein
MVRFPRLYQLLAALAQRLLSPRSRLRRVLVRRMLISAYAAASRRDYDLMLVRYARDAEIDFEPDLEPLGLSGTHRGHDGILAMIAGFEQAWDDPELVPAMVVDMGDRAVGLGHFRLRGAASGIELEPPAGAGVAVPGMGVLAPRLPRRVM